MFSPALIELGDIKVGHEYTMRFDFGVDVNYIKAFTSPCDCSSVSVDIPNRQIVIKYTPKAIPAHLKGQNYYESTKVIEVEYMDNMETSLKQNLVFTATVRK